MIYQPHPLRITNRKKMAQTRKLWDSFLIFVAAFIFSVIPFFIALYIGAQKTEGYYCENFVSQQDEVNYKLCVK